VAPATRPVRVDGLRELSRAFAVADKTLSRELRKGLRDAAEPVRSDAQTLALGRIRNMTEGWSRMRVGVTRTTVYVAPRSRGAGGKRSRRNLFDLMTGRSLEPALDANVNEVENRVDDVLATVGRAWETA
jgi:hypothetical protein